MFDETPHHPRWSFVKGWNERSCKCDRCNPLVYSTQFAKYQLDPAQVIKPYAPAPYDFQQLMDNVGGVHGAWGSPTGNITVASSTTNVK
jgi:hypothetical protein